MKILVVIDMQNDFLTGSLRNEEGIKIIPNVVKKIEEYKKNNDLIIATRDTHYPNYLETQEGNKLPVKHCIINTFGWEIEESIKNALGDCQVIDKPTFGSIELGNIIKKYENLNPEIELVGVCTDICVISNAMIIKANLPEAKIIVDSSLCAGVTKETHNQALGAMKMCQIEII